VKKNKKKKNERAKKKVIKKMRGSIVVFNLFCLYEIIERSLYPVC
jgi:hypothetical protein